MADSFSEHFTIIQGTFLRPAIAEARSRLSPATSSNSDGLTLRTVSGCKIPFSAIDCESEESSFSENCLRG